MLSPASPCALLNVSVPRAFTDVRAMKMATNADVKKRVELETRIFDLGMDAIRRLNQNAVKNT